VGFLRHTWGAARVPVLNQRLRVELGAVAATVELNAAQTIWLERDGVPEPVGSLGAPPVGCIPRVLVGHLPSEGTVEFALDSKDRIASSVGGGYWLALTNSLNDVRYSVVDKTGRVTSSGVHYFDFKGRRELGKALVSIESRGEVATLFRRPSGELVCTIVRARDYDVQEHELGRDIMGEPTSPFFAFGVVGDRSTSIRLLPSGEVRVGDHAFLLATSKRLVVLVLRRERLCSIRLLRLGRRGVTRGLTQGLVRKRRHVRTPLRRVRE
jgi:hypothetical protein